MPDAMISVILVGTWKFFPFVVIAVLARLQSIPLELYEAARVDGAGAWARLRYVTLPQLRGLLNRCGAAAQHMGLQGIRT